MADASRVSWARNIQEQRRIPETRQLTIIHLSDLHFGDYHRFSAGAAVGAGKKPEMGRGSLISTLRRDLADHSDPGCPVIICITGDFAEKAVSGEFRQAETFIKELAGEKLFGKSRGLDHIFVVPGNHDVAFGAMDSEDRWSPWAKFSFDTFGTRFDARDPLSRIALQDRVDDLGAIILCLNSSEYVQRDTPEALRGLMDEFQLGKIKSFLERIDKDRLESAIRIALIHHHPVLIPGLAEPGRGYDAVENSGLLLNLLRNFGFHLILHGHKHSPYHFSEDSYTAFQDETRPPILIVAGGSASSNQLPEGGCNCYNLLQIKWNPEAKQGRFMLRTNALQIRSKGAPLLSKDWNWVPRLIDDRPYLGGPNAPQTIESQHRKFDRTVDQEDEAQRRKHYVDLRYNLPVCEVMPALIPGQHNEVRLWIEHHKSRWNPNEESPVEVTWSAGKSHEVRAVRFETDPRFCATLCYYGPMVVQAKMRFQHGHIACGYVYARMPKIYHRPDCADIDLG